MKNTLLSRVIVSETNHLGELCNPTEYKNVAVTNDSNSGRFTIASPDGMEIYAVLHGADIDIAPNAMTVTGWAAHRPAKQINTSTYLLKKAVVYFEYFGDIEKKE